MVDAGQIKDGMVVMEVKVDVRLRRRNVIWNSTRHL